MQLIQLKLADWETTDLAYEAQITEHCYACIGFYADGYPYFWWAAIGEDKKIPECAYEDDSFEQFESALNWLNERLCSWIEQKDLQVFVDSREIPKVETEKKNGKLLIRVLFPDNLRHLKE